MQTDRQDRPAAFQQIESIADVVFRMVYNGFMHTSITFQLLYNLPYVLFEFLGLLGMFIVNINWLVTRHLLNTINS